MNDKKIISRGRALELSVLANGVAVVLFDNLDGRVNLLSGAVLTELEDVLQWLERPGFCKGVVFISGKSNCFIAGADIKEILHAQEQDLPEQTIYEACQRGKNVLARITALPLPTVAAIHGRCLGGGFELALACQTRIATNDRSTVFGLPEVGLGVLPGWGGTVRTAKSLGLFCALALILNPLRPWTARKAYRKGLVTAIVPQAQLFDAAVSLALGEHSRAKNAKPLNGNWLLNLGARASRPLLRLSRALTDQPIARALTLSIAVFVIKKTVGKKYPAPQAVLAVLQAAYNQHEEAALELESRTFARLCKTDASKRCVQRFLALKKEAHKAKPAAQ